MDNGKHLAEMSRPTAEAAKMQLGPLELRRFQASVQRRADLQTSIVAMAMTMKSQREQFDALVDSLARENVDFGQISTTIAQRLGITGMFDVNIDDGVVSLK